MGFSWETGYNRWDREWKEQLESLKAYKRLYGDCRVPWQFADDQKLSDWVHTQRKVNNKGKMRADRKKALDAIGFVWKAAERESSRHHDAEGEEVSPQHSHFTNL